MDDDVLVPARMINEWIYCPRLAYLEWVDGEWADSADTVMGQNVHTRVDQPTGALPPPDEMPLDGEVVARAITLSAPGEKIIAKLDLVEGDLLEVRPVDYKKGTVPDTPERSYLPERVQVAAQALVLRANGYPCHEGVLYFAESKTRVRLPITDDLVHITREAAQALLLAREQKKIPPPLIDSPKCDGCSLAPICLPDETHLLTTLQKPPADGIRRLLPSRDDALPLHVTLQGALVSKDQEELVVIDKASKTDAKKATARIPQTSAVNIYGNVNLSTPAHRELLHRGVPISYFSRNGWFMGQARSYVQHNLDLRRAQFRAADQPKVAVAIARGFIEAKIKNQRTLLRRNADGELTRVLARMDHLAQGVGQIDDLGSLLGAEGEAAALYFENFPKMLKAGEDSVAFFNWNNRNRRPPTDPINALLSWLYSQLTRECTTVLLNVGFEPLLGFLHQPRPGKPALALDLMEEFRPVLADSVVLSLVNGQELGRHHFVARGTAWNLTDEGRKVVLRAWERRLDTLVTHPTFGYRISYRRVLEVQARLLGRHLMGELDSYPGFKVR